METESPKREKDSLLSKWLNREKKTEEPTGIKPRRKGVKAPLSFGQERLLFLQQLYPENPFYNYADSYRFRGALDIDRLLESFELIVQKHEILRTNFRIEDDQPVQFVNEESEFETSVHDLRKTSEELRFEEARNLAFEEARKPFDLDDGSLLRISALQLNDDDFLIVLTMHHIIFDKWSMSVFLGEISEAYKQLCGGESFKNSPMEIQYGDYSFWQRSQKTDEKNLSYWKKKLENSLELLDLPSDLNRPARPTFRGAYSAKILPDELSKKLRDLCKETNKTLYVLLLTAYKILLHRYSNETDILVGSPFTNRDDLALEGLIGFFNETLVLRSDLSGDPTFSELLERIWRTTQDAFAHKNMPFENLVRALRSERYLNYNPLFQVMFIYHDSPRLPSFGNGITLEQQPFDFGVTKFDLTLYISSEDERITPIFEYSKDIFFEETIERMHGHLQRLLEGIVENPNRRISEMPIITGEEVELFSDWNDTNPDKTTTTSIVELFINQVKQNPQKTAVSFQNEKLTYEELDKRANSIANYLVRLELNKDKPIGLLVEQSSDMLAGILGILKAGFAYLPLDSEYPKDRIDFIIKDSTASIVLTQKQFSDFERKQSVEVQIIDDLINSENSDEPVLSKAINGDDLAYVIYTSGSTGKPKGVSVTHKNLVYSTSARFDFYPNQPEAFLLLSSFSFDSSVVGIFWTLAVGGKIVLVERRAEQDLNYLGEILVNENITHTLLLPTLYSMAIKNLPREQFASFKTIIVAGEACSRTVCREHFEFLPEVELYNEYGPTEATVWATVHKITPEDSKSNIPIGKPISGTQIYILDENQNHVLIGVAGEMYIGGKGVAKGYFNNPDLTNECFLNNPLSQNEGDKLYRTGDLCRYKADGTIEFLGRIDNQVKVRGYRIELGEIQEAIKQNENVKDAVVKLDQTQKTSAANDLTNNENLLEVLEKMSSKDSDEVLKAVEKLSDKEIEFMLNEKRRG